ncbi:DegT/DnrJ/EryC1/StrS family aminotransferase [Chryseobacterium sp. PTM-20240506]|uniref:DegT/DnrJ/EryC1/StrS family aminotransferase n=1 Tax=unclassified Chryseobacterium TaxID=2593645 RepID=UPI002359F32D|nr:MULTISPECIES: aminotransferase class I/II-fold pyridoxal phosphate-dependent enzyme [unclassified Chryseobacterium]MDC8105114.1 aminotransferase class I/II-fold pyridoxal phosphate-dependent enzyme [Chryseobacterium sp. B21-037]MDQ1805371.1 aminotransferase class I/II-fold pyridoxal phosphate-dependent enzyme [Chryseobacterium sp. CKR4-1]
MHDKIWLSPPHLSGNELEFIDDAFQKNWVTSIGNNIDEFENDLRSFLGGNIEVCALNSATSAIHLALMLLGVGNEDDVLTSTFSFVASANPIIYCNANPVFIDSEPETWNMCPVTLEEAIKDRLLQGKKIKAIIVVHLYGMPAKMDEILSIAEKYKIPVIEDAAESLGSRYKGKPCGGFGQFGIISFNGNKIITTSGGGTLICHSKEDKNKAIFLSTQARDDAPHYQHSSTGYNYRMSNIIAGIGRGQMKVLNDRIQARRGIHNFYTALFENIDGVDVFTEPNEDFYSNHWLSAITINSEKTGKTREDLRLALLNDNIESRPLWKPLHLQPVFSNFPYYGGQTAENLFNSGLCLPSGSNLSIEHKERIARVLKDFFKHS